MSIKCRYALNAVHEDVRRTIPTEAAWSQHCRTIQEDWPKGKYAERCGKDAVLLVIHRRPDVIPYCAECFARDMAVVNGQALTIWIHRSESAIEQMRDSMPFLAVGFLERAPELGIFMQAVETWLNHPDVIAELIGVPA